MQRLAVSRRTESAGPAGHGFAMRGMEQRGQVGVQAVEDKMVSKRSEKGPRTGSGPSLRLLGEGGGGEA